jgi:hypothetical protein
MEVPLYGAAAHITGHMQLAKGLIRKSCGKKNFLTLEMVADPKI